MAGFLEKWSRIVDLRVVQVAEMVGKIAKFKLN